MMYLIPCDAHSRNGAPLAAARLVRTLRVPRRCAVAARGRAARGGHEGAPNPDGEPPRLLEDWRSAQKRLLAAYGAFRWRLASLFDA